jgi:hypothetical protein
MELSSPIVDDQPALDSVYAELLGSKPVNSTERPQNAHTGTTALTDFDILAHANKAANAPKFRALWSGCQVSPGDVPPFSPKMIHSFHPR